MKERRDEYEHELESIGPDTRMTSPSRRSIPRPVEVPGIRLGHRRRRSLMPAVLVVIGWFALATIGVAERRDHPVGRAHAGYVDGSRPDWNDASQSRPLVATVWYPATRDAQPSAWTGGVFEFGVNAPDAPFAGSDARRLPLILVSHGTGGSAAQMSWLAEALAARGFIVAGVNHHGNTAAEPRTLLAGFALWWERARDLHVLLDRLLADPRFAARIDAERIGAAGFSLGGFTAMLVAGARVDLEAFRVHCRAHPRDDSCRPPPESAQSADEFERFLAEDPLALASLPTARESFRDPRIRAVFTIAPALMPALADDSLRAVDVPVLVVTGAADTLVLPRFVQALSRRMERVDIDTLDGVGHYAFLATCTEHGQVRLPHLCVDAAGVDRRAVHRHVADQAADFFKRNLCPAHRSSRPPERGAATAPEVDPCSTP